MKNPPLSRAEFSPPAGTSVASSSDPLSLSAGVEKDERLVGYALSSSLRGVDVYLN